jgi:hypothetical protein
VLVGSCSLKQSFLVVDYHDFSLVIGPIVITEKNAMGVSEKGGRAGLVLGGSCTWNRASYWWITMISHS